MRSQPGSLGQGKGWERSMQGQGHAWAQPASRASHVGESVALAQRLVLLGVERLPFQVGLADLGEESAGGQRGPRGPLPRSAPAALPLSTGLVQAPRSSRLRGTTTERGGETLVDSGPPLQPPPASSQHPGREGRGRRVAHRADEASVVPAEAQRLQEPVPGIDLEVAAAALGAKHLLVVCEQKQSRAQRSPSLRALVSPCSRAQPGDISRPAQDRDNARSARHPGQGVPDRHHAAGRRRTSAPRMQHSL